MPRQAAAVTNDMFRSLRIRNYRLYWIGQAISMTGTWLQFIGQALLVLRLTDSGVALGLVTACQFVPVLFFGGWAGVLADRVDKRRVMYVTQSAMMLFAFSLAGLVLGGVVEVGHVYVLAALTGVAAAFDQPARRALIGELVDQDHINNAVGLSSAVFTGSRVLGPALAGLLIGTVGVGWCFLLNGLSFVGALAGLALMNPAEFHPGPRLGKGRGQIRAGVRYVWSSPTLRLTMGLVAVVAVFGFNWQVLVPLLATRTFHGTATTYTIITSMMSVGSFLGSLWLARRRSISVQFLALTCVAFGGASLLFAASPTVPIAIATGMVTAALGITFMSGTMTFVQVEAVPEMRGRAMALYTILFMGTTPVGGPIVGWVAEQYSTRAGLALGGLVAVGAGFVALAHLRRRAEAVVAAAAADTELALEAA
ncbi:MAG: MFS transporter [Acidimicrobiales bacterium]